MNARIPTSNQLIAAARKEALKQIKLCKDEISTRLVYAAILALSDIGGDIEQCERFAITLESIINGYSEDIYGFSDTGDITAMSAAMEAELAERGIIITNRIKE